MEAERANQEMFMMILDEQRTFQRHISQQMRQFMYCQMHRSNSGIQYPSRSLLPRITQLEKENDSTATSLEQRRLANVERYAPNLNLRSGGTQESAIAIPSIGNKMPHLAVDCLEDHLRLNLDRYRNIQKDKMIWGSTAMRFSRRLAAFLFIEERSRTLRNTTGRGAALLEAAKRIDAEKGDSSLTQFLSQRMSRKTRNSQQKGIKRRRILEPTFL